MAFAFASHKGCSRCKAKLASSKLLLLWQPPLSSFLLLPIFKQLQNLHPSTTSTKPEDISVIKLLFHVDFKFSMVLFSSFLEPHLSLKL